MTLIDDPNVKAATNTPTLKKALPGRIELYFDPTDEKDLNDANKRLTELLVNPNGSTLDAQKAICPIQLTNTLPGAQNAGRTGISRPHTKIPPEANGVLYRPLTTYYLTVFNGLGEMGTNSVQYIVRSPNQSPVFEVSATDVRMAVARLEFTSATPSLAKIAVTPAKRVDNKAQVIQFIKSLVPV
jgi:hypothetical protein